MENISTCKKCKKRFAEISSSQALEIKTSGMFSGGPGFGDLNHFTFAVMSWGRTAPWPVFWDPLRVPLCPTTSRAPPFRTLSMNTFDVLTVVTLDRSSEQI